MRQPLTVEVTTAYVNPDWNWTASKCRRTGVI